MSTQPGQQTTWLTQEAYDRLSAELEDAKGPKRADIVAKIEAARDEGDLKENGGYHAAKDEQGKNEARIRQLTQMLEKAVVGEAPTASDTAGPGMVVEVAFDGDRSDTDKYLLGSREDKGTSGLNAISLNSPLGVALNGAKVGDSVTYSLPNGSSATVEILTTEPYSG
ncbi:MAG: transcription elongation factor GreA [Frankiales bacterium]|nr:transcription elongation factor GreA [Frankiales bacterium]